MKHFKQLDRSHFIKPEKLSWTPQEITSIKHIFNLNSSELAKVLGIQTKDVTGWEKGQRRTCSFTRKLFVLLVKNNLDRIL